MYQNGFVVAIRVGERFVEEKTDGKFVVPFNSEYSIRIKNRNDRKAVARIYIDGEEVNHLGKFILDPNGTLDLERFVKELDLGNKFKFVPINNSMVKDRNNGENGFVEARFQLVKPVEAPIIYDHHHHYNIHYDYTPAPYNTWRYPYGCNGTGYTMAIGGGTCSAAAPMMVSNCCNMEKGATIDGDISNQKFSYSYVGELESAETVIRVQLIGSSDPEVLSYYVKIHCKKCGKKYGSGDEYCSSCGTKR